MSFLKISHLRKSYGALEILKDINIEIEEGGFLVLVGPSGCGKSTLLNTIAGLEPITSGEIAINGRNVADLPPSQRDIAMVFQSYALYPNMTVAGNIAFGMEIRKVPKDERDKAIKEVSDILQIGHLLDRKPSQLSGGQRQRVAMGRALVRNPQVFLFDEPLSNLDAKLRQQLREEIVDLHRRTGITFIYVTHDQTEAMAMSDRIAVMEGGEIRQCAAPEEIYDRPEFLSVARFVGTTAINEMQATIKEGVVSVNGRLLRLRLAGIADGTYQLAVRPERLCPAEDGASDFSLPVLQIEFTGNEVGVRCNGAEIGAGTVRVQLRPDSFAQLRQGRNVGERIPLSIAEGAALIFDSAGRRLTALQMQTPLAPEDRHEYAV